MKTGFGKSVSLALAVVVLAGTLQAASEEISPVLGDRAPGTVQVWPERAFYHNGKGGIVLDVTKPPFNAKGDGVTDDTSALSAALRFVRDNQRQAGTGTDSLWCARWDSHWVVYIPDGIYLVSDTVCQGWPALTQSREGKFEHMRHITVASLDLEKELGDAMYDEINWQIRIVGQSRERTVLRLKDRADGFGRGAARPVLSNLMLVCGSADNPGNFVENLTIDTGNGNPGAVALRWNCSNHGAIRNVALRSGDGNGAVGLLMDAWNATGHARDLRVTGFRTGIKLAAGRETMMAMEHVSVDAIETGLAIGGHVETVGGNEKGGGDPLGLLHSVVTARLPVAVSRDGLLAAADSRLNVKPGGKLAVILDKGGAVSIRDVTGEGRQGVGHEAGLIAEYDRDGVGSKYVPPAWVSTGLQGGGDWKRLPVREPPRVEPGPVADWAVVEDFGAKGDGVTDDTAAVQRAMDSGRATVFFASGLYRIDGTVKIPSSVKFVTGVYSTVYRAAPAVAGPVDPPALFCVASDCRDSLVMSRFRSAGAVFVDHAAPRVLSLEDVYVVEHHWQCWLAKAGYFLPFGADVSTRLWRCWRNTDPKGARKTLFLTQCGMASADLGHDGEAFVNADVWARMLNTEHVRNASGTGACFSAKNADLWIFGFKSEASDTLIKAVDRSRVEVLVGTYLRWDANTYPLCVCDKSELSAFVSFWQYDCFKAPALVLDGKANVAAADVPKLDGINCGVAAFATPARPEMDRTSIRNQFHNPPTCARTGVWWHWMGDNVSTNGILKDLAYFKRCGITSATIFGLCDICTPWATPIPNSPGEGLVVFSPAWWQFVRLACEEGKRIGIDIGIHNCPGYTSTGGPWIPPPLAMRELYFARTNVTSTGGHIQVPRPDPNPSLTANAWFPVYDESSKTFRRPDIPARRTDINPVAVFAIPCKEGAVDPKEIRVSPSADFDLPPGAWTILWAMDIPMGAFTQPNPWSVFGLECDKMNAEAVRFHLAHVEKLLKDNLGDLVGTGLKHILLDSYEAGDPSWTPAMRGEFQSRRGYDILPWLPALAGVTIGSEEETKKFKDDFQATKKELYHDNLFRVMGDWARGLGLKFACEPYEGPFDSRTAAESVDRVMTEFWFDPAAAGDVPARLGWEKWTGPGGKRHTVIEAESFTGQPENCAWSETLAQLKACGDRQYLRGVNRFILHTNPLQAWEERGLPGLSMGRWGTHFGRTQVWAADAKVWLDYTARCQALLQWGEPSDVVPVCSTPQDVGLIARQRGHQWLCFVANLRDRPIETKLFGGFVIMEWFDPVTGETTELQHTYRNTVSNRQEIALSLAPRQTGFLVLGVDRTCPPMPTGAGFRLQNLSEEVDSVSLAGSWQVRFDPARGGPAEPVVFETLTDWTTHEDARIRYYSGTAEYRQTCDCPFAARGGGWGESVWVEFENLNGQSAQVEINGQPLGTVWCAPWRVRIPAGVLREKGNEVVIRHTNVWANRLIGDEQEEPDCEWADAPYGTGRYLKRFPDWFRDNTARGNPKRKGFVTWNYFTKDSPLVPSGPVGAVRLTLWARIKHLTIRD